MMKIVTVIVALICTLSIKSTFAQTSQHAMIQKLASPTQTGANVSVISDFKGDFIQGSSSSKVRSYKVRIYFDNSQTAREGSQTAKSRFSEMFPNTVCNLEYKAPHFKVTAGNFLTREEAIALWGQIVNVFPKAFIVNETTSISTFGKKIGSSASTSVSTDIDAESE